MVHSLMYCKKCGWTAGMDVGHKNECPNCKITLYVVKGTEQEINDFIFTNIAMPVPVYGASFPD